MITKLKKNERLIHAGYTALRAPAGTLLESVPQYMIVPADEADPAATVKLRKSEVLVIVGQVNNDLSAAKERYAAALRGEKPKRVVDGKTLYIKVEARDIDPETGLSSGERHAIHNMALAMTPLFEKYVDNLARQKA